MIGLGWSVLRGLSGLLIWCFLFIGLIALTQSLWPSFFGALILAGVWFVVASMHDWRGAIAFGLTLGLIVGFVLVFLGAAIHRGVVG